MPVDYSLTSGNVKLSTIGTGSGASQYGVSAGGAQALSGFFLSYAESQYQQAAAISQSANYLVNARDTLALSQVRAGLSETYAWVQAGRTMQKAEQEARNWTIAGNTLMKNLRATNATARARAAASGINLDTGSIVAAQTENTRNVLKDVAITDLNAVTAKVLGFEDASAMIQSTDYQNFINNFQASRQAGQYESAAATARTTGGMLSDITLARGVYNLAKSV